jgi:hypothetical protein
MVAAVYPGFVAGGFVGGVVMADKSVVAPAFCPLCGSSVEVVRHVTNNLFEMMCERCKLPCVVLSNDSVVQSVQESGTTDQRAQDVLVQPEKTKAGQS